MKSELNVAPGWVPTSGSRPTLCWSWRPRTTVKSTRFRHRSHCLPPRLGYGRCSAGRAAARSVRPVDEDPAAAVESVDQAAAQDRAHARAATVRRDVLHKATTAPAQCPRVIVVETVNAAGMRSGGEAYMRGLNRALADAALAQIRRMLGYKSCWYGSTGVEADRWFPSSKTCSGCGRRQPNLTLADRTYVCAHCGVMIDRDHNAAINLARPFDVPKAKVSPDGATGFALVSEFRSRPGFRDVSVAVRHPVPE